MTVRGRNDSRSSQVTPTERPGQTVYVGIPASPGVVIGTLFVAPSAIALDAVLDKASADPDAERAALETAMHALGEEFRMSRNTQASRLPEAIGALYGVNEMILADPDLLGEITHRIYAGQSAAAAVRDTVDIIARQFEAMENAYLRTRAEDVRAVGRRILRHLMSRDADRHALPERTILLGKGLGLACLSAIPGEQLAGLICTGGSTLSHGVILARALGIPAVVGVATMPLDQADGREVILDGYRGRVILNPEPAVRAELVNLQQEGSLHTQAPADEHELSARTIDGVQVALHANISLRSEIRVAKEQGAEGVGLYRTEWPFLLGDDAPAEDAQYAIYRELLEAFFPHPVTMRTLDAGGDKPLPYLPQDEANPALGRRGIRLCLAHPKLFLTQLRALLRANASLGNLRLMLPMITLPSDIAQARVFIERAHGQLQSAGQASTLPPVGIMVEVPAAVFGIDTLADMVDFISIGTNDLAQYVLAADRTNPALENLCDALTPAVLRAIGMAADGAARRGIPVGVCGELAGDPFGALLLLGLGVDSLSLSAAGIPHIRRLVRRVSRKDARALWKAALNLGSAGAVRSMLAEALEVRGLGADCGRHLVTVGSGP